MAITLFGALLKKVKSPLGGAKGPDEKKSIDGVDTHHKELVNPKETAAEGKLDKFLAEQLEVINRVKKDTKEVAAEKGKKNIELQPKNHLEIGGILYLAESLLKKAPEKEGGADKVKSIANEFKKGAGFLDVSFADMLKSENLRHGLCATGLGV